MSTIKVKKLQSTSQVVNLIKQIQAASKQRPPSSNKTNKFATFHSNFLPQIDKEQVRHQVKERMRRKWKDSGYPAGEFEKPSVLKAKVLNAWEMERIHLSRRSYEIPKGFRGMKVYRNGSEFPPSSTEGLPQKVVEYITKCEDNYIDAMYDPTNTLKTYQSKIEKVMQDHKSIFKRINTVQNNAFGYSRVGSRSLSQATINRKIKR